MEPAKETAGKWPQGQEAKENRGAGVAAAPSGQMCPSSLPPPASTGFPLGTRPSWGPLCLELEGQRLSPAPLWFLSPTMSWGTVSGPMRSVHNQETTQRDSDSRPPFRHLSFEHQGHDLKPESFPWKRRRKTQQSLKMPTVYPEPGPEAEIECSGYS